MPTKRRLCRFRSERPHPDQLLPLCAWPSSQRDTRFQRPIRVPKLPPHTGVGLPCWFLGNFEQLIHSSHIHQIKPPYLSCRPGSNVLATINREINTWEGGNSRQIS